MPDVIKNHCIVSTTNGVLQGTTPDDVVRIVNAAADKGHIVIHLHGGLVKESDAKETARTLAQPYLNEANAYPIFMVYKTGLLDTIKARLVAIKDDLAFKAVRDTVLKWIVGKAEATRGGRSISSVDLPDDLEIIREISRLTQNEIPFKDLDDAEVQDLTDAQRADFTTEIESNPDLVDTVHDIVARHDPAGRGSRTVTGQPLPPTLLSQDVIDDLMAENPSDGSRGFISMASLSLKALGILTRTIRRKRSGRDHGTYATIVEETLRGLYVDKLGASLWHEMKREAIDTFTRGPDNKPRAGEQLLKALNALTRTPPPKVSIVAHSMGSVYACALIERWSGPPLHQVHFLAPAADYAIFARTLSAHAAKISTFRMFTLDDKTESGYWEIKGVYPRSLLYLVSGLFERNTDNSGAYDHPILGMQRYHDHVETYRGFEFDSVRAYLNAKTIWSPTPPGTTPAADSITHGAFDDLGNNGSTMRSVFSLLYRGLEPPSPLHFGVAVGIDTYPAFDPLNAAAGDARDFADWLRDPAGGNLDPANVHTITNSRTDPPGRPIADEVLDAIQGFRQRADAIKQSQPDAWENLRLYLFMAGHGIAPAANDAALLMGNSDKDNLGRNIACSVVRDWFIEAQCFGEILLLADCCRDRLHKAPPPSVCWSRMTGRNGKVRTLTACATYFGDLAWEESDEDAVPHDQRRGYFTRALLNGLRGEAADEHGHVYASNLGHFVKERVKEATKNRRKPQEPTFETDVSHPLLICSVQGRVRPKRTVTLHRPPGFAGALQIVQSERVIDTTPAQPGASSLSLHDGLYEVKPLGAPPGLILANDGLFKVNGEDRDVTL